MRKNHGSQYTRHHHLGITAAAALLFATTANAGLLTHENLQSITLGTEVFKNADTDNWYTNTSDIYPEPDAGMNWLNPGIAGIWQVVAVSGDGMATVDIGYDWTDGEPLGDIDWEVSVFGFTTTFDEGVTAPATMDGLGLSGAVLASITESSPGIAPGTGAVSSDPFSFSGVDYLLVTAYAQNTTAPNAFRLTSIQMPITAVPEPSTFALFGTALAATALRLRRRKK
jgi:hypothetical protein